MKYYMTTKNNRNNLWSPFSIFDDMFATGNVTPKRMHTDIVEKENQYVMSIELAGYNKDDIKLDYDNGYLTVSASRDAKEEENYIVRESHSTASRSYYVGDIDLASVKASYTNGVLQVTLPKEEVKKSTSITIE